MLLLLALQNFQVVSTEVASGRRDPLVQRQGRVRGGKGRSGLPPGMVSPFSLALWVLLLPLARKGGLPL